ncbi:MAG: hypothetical protein COV67_01260 [Nitrospinae bacterium CG11_big_fil_rev_8_21_14_0_20_56_8]|nr:MAG: hypothetical protein COV67_01260 [Nitrospinae bacterium CG11_big_fil_rev_8_21_14_0_20_56_8]
MATSSVSGINSNLDTADIISKLVALEARPIDLLQSQADQEAKKLLDFNNLKTKLQSFKSFALALNTESRFISTKGKFTNSDPTDTSPVVDIVTTSQASSGTFTLTVNQLARETKTVSDGFASTTSSIPTGTVRIVDGSRVTFVTVDETNNTLDGLRLALNNSGANLKANFINDGDTSNPIRLLISGTKTGTQNALDISFKFSQAGAFDTDAITFTTTQAAQDAELVVDGVSVTKQTNVVNDVITGTTMTLLSAGDGTITLSTDVNSITQKVTDFVGSYNDLILFLKDELAIDSSSNKTGVLFGNVTVQNIQQTLRSTISAQIAGVTGSFSFLSQVGITTQDDGTLEVDKSILADALTTDTVNVSQLFSSKGTTNNVGVTFVGFTNNTVAGTYDVRVLNGVPQLSPSGENNYTDATGSGNFFAGATGTAAEGLNFRISSLTDGSYGSITLTTGVAEIFNRQMTNLLDTSLQGPLSAEINTITDTITNYDDQIARMEERLTLFQQKLEEKFTNMEVVLGKLNSQRDTFTQALSGIQSLFQKK